MAKPASDYERAVYSDYERWREARAAGIPFDRAHQVPRAILSMALAFERVDEAARIDRESRAHKKGRTNDE